MPNKRPRGRDIQSAIEETSLTAEEIRNTERAAEVLTIFSSRVQERLKQWGFVLTITDQEIIDGAAMAFRQGFVVGLEYAELPERKNT